MTEPLERLFDEYALAYVRGEAPDVRAFLERASESERKALGRLIDRFLEAAPARPPTEEELVLLQAQVEAEPPLLLLRCRRGLGRPEVVLALMRALGLDPAKEEKVASYYHRLEVGMLDPEPVHASVWDALGELLRANVRALAGVRLEPLAAEPQHRRADVDFALEEPSVPPARPDEGRDEVDRLFTGAG